MNKDFANEVLGCFLSAMDDYTLDRRGDIGAWVREAAMQGLTDLLLQLSEDLLVPEDRVAEAMARMAQQACEKIDRTRGLAARLFIKILLHDRPSHVPGIPEREAVVSRLPSPFDPATFQWKVESETFPVFVSLLDLDAYRDRVILGLVVSVGGLTERLVKFSSAALFAQLRNSDRASLDEFCQGFLRVFRANQKNDRVTIPLMKSVDQLLTSGFLDPVVEDAGSTFCMDLLTCVKAEISKCGDPNKLIVSCDVLCGLLQSADEKCAKKVLTQLAIFLCHKFPRMRRVTAGKIFEALLTYSDRELVSEDKVDEVNAILGETKWEQMTVEDLRPIRNKFCELMDVPAPAIIKKVVG